MHGNCIVGTLAISKSPDLLSKTVLLALANFPNACRLSLAIGNICQVSHYKSQYIRAKCGRSNHGAV